MQRFPLRAAAALLAALALPSSARTYYVDALCGDDANTGLKPGLAFATLQHAAEKAAAGSTVLVAPGVYAPFATTRKLSIKSTAGRAETAIDGGGAARCATLAAGAQLAGFTLQNGAADYGAGAQGGVLRSCALVGNRSTYDGAGAQGSTLYGCEVLDNAGARAIGGGLARCTAYNTLVARNSAATGGGAAYSTLYNCTVADNEAARLGGLNECKAYGCVVFGNGTDFSADEVAAGTAVLAYCCTETLPSKGKGNVAADPCFVDRDGGDYRLLPWSPCADAGADYTKKTGKSDLADLPRKVGKVDMGAYELPAAKPVAADWDGDGTTDAAVYFPATSEWWIWQSRDGLRIETFGAKNAVPCPADYDEAGVLEPAVFTAAEREPRFGRLRADGTEAWTAFGTKGATPLSRKPAAGAAAVFGVYSANAKKPAFSFEGGLAVTFGAKGSKPVAADFDQDGADDPGVYTATASKPAFSVLQSSRGFSTAALFLGKSVALGAKGSEPAVADYDRDGLPDFGAYSGSAKAPEFQRVLSSSKWWERRILEFGSKGCAAAPGDWNGDGAADVAVFDGARFHWVDSNFEVHDAAQEWIENGGGAASAGDYEILFDAAGGIGGRRRMSADWGEDVTLPAAAPTRPGYHFLGWKDEGGAVHAAGATVAALVAAPATSTTLAATWEVVPVAYTVAFSANGGTGAIAPVAAVRGEPTTLPSGGFSRSGYLLAGWAKTATGAAVWAPGETAVLNLAATEGATVTLYAAWSKTPPSVQPTYEYEVNGDGRTCTITRAAGGSGAIVIPSTLGGYRVTAVGSSEEGGNGAFEENWNITSVTIPEGVTDIGYCAFCYCGKLASVSLPSTLGRIGFGAFEGCAFASVVLPEGLEEIGEVAFADCGSLATISIPASVTAIGEAAFEECSSLSSIRVAAGNGSFKSVDGCLYSGAGTRLLAVPAAKTGSLAVPAGVVEIGDSAFSGSSLSSVSFPEGVESLGEDIFRFCNRLESVSLPASLSSIGYGPFAYCPSLSSVSVASGNRFFKSENGALLSADGTILIAVPAGKTGAFEVPSGVVRIEQEAFSCVRISSVRLPASLEDFCIEPSGGASLRGNFFYQCPDLASIEVASGNTAFKTVGGALLSADGEWLFCVPPATTGSYSIPSGVRYVSERAFWAHDETIPDIPYGSGFYRSAITSLTIPASVEGFGSSSLWYDPDLGNYWHFNATSENPFEEMIALASFSVQAGSTSFSASDGVLFNADKTKLFAYPPGKTGSSYRIPESVTSGCRNAFGGARWKNLKTVTLTSAQKDYFWLYGVETIVSDQPPPAVTYTVQFSANGGTGSTASISATVGAASTLPACGFTRNGFSFAGWATTASGAASWQAGQTAVLDLADTAGTVVTLYAAWTKIPAIENVAPTYETDSIDGEYGSVEGCQIKRATGGSGAVSVPRTIGGHSVLSIGPRAFAGNSAITSVTVPEGVTGIGSGAFADCRNLVSVSLPSTLEAIGESAFRGTALSSVTIPAAVTLIWPDAFGDCPLLASVSVASGNANYKSDGGALFSKDGTTLYLVPGAWTGSYSVPSGVTKIDRTAFAATGLSSVALPASFDRFGFDDVIWEFDPNDAHDMDDDWVHIPYDGWAAADPVPPPSLVSWTVASGNADWSAQDGVLFGGGGTRLVNYPPAKTGTSYTVPSTVTEIGPTGFAGQGNLATVSIPATVTSAHGSAFADCRSLVSISVDDGNPNYRSEGGALVGTGWGSVLMKVPCGKTGSFSIPDDVDTVAEGAFDGTRISSVSIPASVGADRFNDGSSSWSNPFEKAPELGWINVAAGNETLKSEEGCLYTADGTWLLAVPAATSGAFVVPDGVEYVDVTAFSAVDESAELPVRPTAASVKAWRSARFPSGITSVSLPASLVSIGRREVDYDASWYDDDWNWFPVYICRSCDEWEGEANGEYARWMTNPFTGLLGLASVSVVTGNQDFKSSGGVLLNKDGSLLVAYPPAKTASSYTIPSTVRSIAVDAFTDASWANLGAVSAGSKATADMVLHDIDPLSGLSVAY